MMTNFTNIIYSLILIFFDVYCCKPQNTNKALVIKSEKREEAIKDNWIIVFKKKEKSDGISIKEVKEDHFNWLEEKILSKSSSSANNNVINVIETKYGMGSFHAYSGKFEEDMIESISERPEIEYIEEDKIVSINFEMMEINERIKSMAKIINEKRHRRRPPWWRRPRRPKPPRRTPIITTTVTLTSSVSSTSTKTGTISSTKTDTKTTSSKVTTTEISSITQNNAEWNLARLSQRERVTTPYLFKYPSSQGSEIRVYILDTGIDISHPDFQGRAEWGENFVDNRNEDDSGHGTHVAGIVGSSTFGVAKGSKIIAVKVLDGQGSGSDSGILKALNWVFLREASMSSKKTKAIINMSLGGSYSKSLNDAVDSTSLGGGGIAIVVASGNESTDSCSTSPSSAEGAMAVMASEKMDSYSSFSNWGSCSDIIAPGSQIKSTYKNGSTTTMSGTSMASPHIAGLMAIYLSLPDIGDLEPRELYSLIQEKATKNAISSVPQGTLNLLAYL